VTTPSRILFVCFGALLASRAVGADFDLAAATNATGIDLGRQLIVGPEENWALSPYSIESALALAYAGAEGPTRAEMARALHFPDADSSIAAAFTQSRAQLHEIALRAGAQWQDASRLFGQAGYAFRPSFLTLLADGYGAPFEPADFRLAAEPARQRINAWVADSTQGKISNLIPAGAIDAHTRLVLVNGLYLKVPWRYPFKASRTDDQPFHFNDGQARNVRTMGQTDHLGYRKEGDFVAVTLPYAGGDLQFLILLPDRLDGADRLSQELSPDLLQRCANLPTREVALRLPRFKFDGPALPLGRELRALGMKSAFDQPAGSADFSRAAPRTPNDYLALSEVYHQAFVAVNEQGTEAAAATGGVMLSTFAVEAGPGPIVVQVDHPFLFAIQQRSTGLCLFLGRVNNPLQ
jgi:serpin B